MGMDARHNPPTAPPDEFVAVLQDYMNVTRRLQDTHELLQREVVRLRGELESKNRELERRRRLAALGELAAGVAHEVRNPLAAIQLYSGLLKRSCDRDADLLRLIDKIEAGIRAIDGVVQDTLTLAPRGGAFGVTRLHDVLAGARDVCMQTLLERGISYDGPPDAPDALVQADPDALQRVFVNLIINAAQASAPQTRVAVQLAAPRPGWIDVTVQDRGSGVPPELLDKVFDPFFTTKSSGTGLGLTIAHRLVEAHGGQLTVRNRDGGGTEFTVSLPTAERAQELSQSDPRRAAGDAA